MKNILTNKITYVILIALLLSVVSIRLLTVDSGSKMDILNGKMYTYEMLSQKIYSVESVIATTEESVLPSGTPAITKTNKLNQTPYKQNGQKKLTNATIRNQPSSEASQVLSSSENASPSTQGMSPEIKIKKSLTLKPIGNDQSYASVYVLNTSLKNESQKAKPNGPGVEGSLPIGDGVWLLLLFAIGYSIKKNLIR